MSFLKRLLGKNKTTQAAQHPAEAGGTGGNTDRQSRREARRQLLFVAVRESMIRAGVLSASYKFKVLSLDSQGEKFIIMIGMSPGTGGPLEHLSDIETLITQTAKTRLGLQVAAVYWRRNEDPTMSNDTAAHPSLRTIKQPTVASTKLPEPLLEDEIVAFKMALAASGQQAPVNTGTKTHDGLKAFTQPTHVEDPEFAQAFSRPALSNTQYGDLN